MLSLQSGKQGFQNEADLRDLAVPVGHVLLSRAGGLVGAGAG